MPPYFSVHYSFPYSYFFDNFTEGVYNTIFERFPFKSGYGESKDNTLE